MKNERWEDIEQVFHAARERNGEERARYLDEVCGPDVGLRRKVELLLQEDDKTERLLNTPAVELIVATLSPSTAVGRYEVVGVAGRGGMGQVYRARDRRLKREVAIKTLPVELAHDKQLLARFQREATVLASLNHPNIATIYDVVERDGAPFLVLEFIDGATLAERLLRGALPVDEILRIASQIAMGLQAAHEKGIVHLDLKPGNIMITANGTVKVLDFGLAKRRPTPELKAGEDPTTVATEPGVLMGTIYYMSPEQALGRDVDHRSDIFSMGVVLYEMATGRRPFSGSRDMETLNAIINTEPAPIASLNTNVPAGLEHIITRCLEKKVENRFQSAVELLDDLRKSDLDRQSAKLCDRSRNNLPQPLTRFIGRQREMAEVGRLLSESRLVTLSGTAGIGKTRLALQMATESLNQYQDGVWFVELAALTDSGLVPQTVAFTLGVREEPGRSITDTLVDFLGRKQLLLVLDNCEHLVGACAQLTDALLRVSPGLHILATSREALGIIGETVFRVPALSVPDSHRLTELERLGQHEAVQLFVDRARAVKPTFTVTNQSAQVLAKACIRLEGIPLAIELAASRVKVLSIEQIDARLDDRLGLLTGGSRTVLPRHQTLLAAIDWSYKLLTEAEKTLFCRLSVFSGGWTLEAAEAVCAGNGLEHRDVLEMLSELVDKSLVLAEEREGQPRYRFMVTLLEYARQRLTETQECEDMLIRYAKFFLALAEEAEQKLIGSEQSVWLERLSTEYDNMRAVLNWTLGKDAEIGLRLAGALGSFWLLRSSFGEARKWLTNVLEGNDSLAPRAQRAKVLNTAGSIVYRQGEYASATSLSEQALTSCRELGDKQGIATALSNLGNVAFQQGDYATAQSLHQESLAIRRELGDKSGIAASLNNLGLVAKRQGDYASARSLQQESLAIRRELGDKWGTALSLGNLGNVAFKQGDYATARLLQQDSLAIRRELGDRHGIAMSLGNLGLVTYEEGDYRAARLLQQDSLAIRRELGDKWGIAQSLYNLGLLAHAQGDQVGARSFHDESLAIRRELGDKHGMAESLSNLGFLAYDQGDQAAAKALLEESLAIRKELGDKPGMATALSGLGDVARSLPDYAVAFSFYKQSLAIWQDLDAKAKILRLLERLAALALAGGYIERAVRLWGAAQALREKMSVPRPPNEAHRYDKDIANARSALSQETFTAAWSSGRAMALDEAIDYAQQDETLDA